MNSTLRRILPIMTALSLLFFSTFNFQIAAQTKKAGKKREVCKIGNTMFRCSRYFSIEEILDANTLLFKERKKESPDSDVFLFVSISNGIFDEYKVKNRIAGKISSDVTKTFVWRELEPGLMDLESRFEKMQKSSLGYNGSDLVHFISRQFTFKNQNIIVGYVYDVSRDATKGEYESWLGGDNAYGCNEIATIVNSITKESKEVEQYCSITGTAPAN